MKIDAELPGLERLLKTCRDEGLTFRLFPPAQRPLLAGALICGLPVDPLLEVAYRHLGGLYITDFLDILRYDDDFDSLTEITSLIGGDATSPFRSFLFFGNKPSLAYYIGTLPALADEAGRQPVFYLDAYLEPKALPIASNVDRFFDLYARYLEVVMEEGVYQLEGTPMAMFPHSVPHLAARDRPLVELIKQGRIEPWVPTLEPEQQEVRKWMAQVLAAHEHGSTG